MRITATTPHWVKGAPAAPAVTAAGSATIPRGESTTVEVTISNGRPGLRADLGDGVDVLLHEFLGGNAWRLHVLARPQATPGPRGPGVFERYYRIRRYSNPHP